jgi:imidazolonepropionase-like amidohydrolase
MLLLACALVVGLTGCGAGGAVRTAVPLPPRFVAQAGDLAFVDVSVIDVLAGAVVPAQTVVVRGQGIVAVADAADVDLPAGVTRVDGHGKFLMPGLADMHVHTWSEAELTMFVAAGVTTVRNMYGDEMHIDWRRRIAAGELVGPTITTAGPIVDGKPPVWPGSAVVESVADADRVVAEQKAAGYDFIKVYSKLTPEAYEAVAAAAKREDMVFAGHVPFAVPLAHALELRQRSIEHLEGYLGALLADGFEKPKQGSYTERLAAMLDHVDERKLPGVIAATVAADVWNCPTLVVIDRISHLGDPAALSKGIRWLEYVPADTLARWDPKADFRFSHSSAADYDVFRRNSDLQKHVIAPLVAAGGRLLVGTDQGNPYVVAGAALHDEIELLVDAGVPRPKVLRAATAGAAEYLDQGGTFGQVTVGARADLILADENPLAGAIALPPSAVVLRGRWLDRGELEKRLEALKPR